MGGEQGVRETGPSCVRAGALLGGSHPRGPVLSPLLWLRQWCSTRTALAIILWGQGKGMRLGPSVEAWPGLWGSAQHELTWSRVPLETKRLEEVGLYLLCPRSYFKISIHIYIINNFAISHPSPPPKVIVISPDPLQWQTTSLLELTIFSKLMRFSTRVWFPSWMKVMSAKRWVLLKGPQNSFPFSGPRKVKGQ